MRKYAFAVVGLAALGLLPTGVNAASGVKVGMLSCDISGGIGLILGSSKAIDCMFQPGGNGPPEHYAGHITKLGVDIGITGKSVVVWAVFAPGKVNRGGLQGTYVGATAEATAVPAKSVSTCVARITGQTPPMSAIYSATKGAVDAITAVLAKELGPKKIRVNSINPGGVETEGVHTLGIIGSDFAKQMVAETPLGRFGQPQDIAPVAVFLASENSGWLTGETLAHV